MNNKTLSKLATGVLLGLLSVLLIVAATQWIWPGLFDAFEAKSLDWRYKNRLANLYEERQGTTIDDIIIVDIDKRSLEKLGRFDNWPRSYHAQVIDFITSGGALAIGFDVLFMEPDKDPTQDQRLIASTTSANIVYHSMAFSRADSNAFLYPMESPPAGFDFHKFSISFQNKGLVTADRMDGQLIDLYNAAAGVGFANFFPDNDGVIRTMPLFLNFCDRQYMSLSLAMVAGILNAGGKDIHIIPGKEVLITPPGGGDSTTFRIPVDRDGRMLVNYQGTWQTFRPISYYDVLMHRIPPETFEGRIVLVGTSAAGLADLRPVPFQDAFPGVEIHANIIYDILAQEFITSSTAVEKLLNLVALAILIGLIAMLLKPWQSALIAIILLGGYGVVTILVFAEKAHWLEMVRPALTLVFSYLFVFMYRYRDEERNKRYIKNMFKFYLSGSVVEELLKNPDMLELGGEKRIATALFSDIKSFTTVSESLTPEELVLQLNEYLAAMTRHVLDHEGYLDKYEGDAIMAIFGVPVEQPDHAERAVKAALGMQRELQSLREKWQLEGKPQFHARIGINTGAMIAGNIGGTDRFDYTVIGDAVNLASRLEGANKQYGTNIMISEFTRELLPESYVLRELDLIRVKGKTQPVRVFEVLAENRAGLSNEQLNLLDQYNQGLQLYRKRNWDAAILAFDRALLVDPVDGPSKTYVKRCVHFKQHAVPSDWDGVFEMKTK